MVGRAQRVKTQLRVSAGEETKVIVVGQFFDRRP